MADMDSATTASIAVDSNVGGDTADQISAFEKILERFEQNQLTARDKGTSFELLVRDIFSMAQPWCEQFSKVQTFSEWAHEHPEFGSARDLGIDLVATNRITPKSKVMGIENIRMGGGTGYLCR